jgi:osmoprotectant transport system permease protein
MSARLLLTAMLALACSPTALAQTEPLRVGSKKFTESVLLGEVARLSLEQAGTKASHKQDLGGTRVLFAALERGDLDAYPEYTGTLLKEILAADSPGSLADADALLEARGLARTEPLGFNNTYALGMRKERARELGITKVSDLAKHPELQLGFSNEFLDRGDGWPGLQRAYGLPQKPRGLDHDLAYRGLDEGTLDVVDCYSTDAEIRYYDLLTLEDDRAYFPRYDAIFLYRADLETRAPGGAAALRVLAGQIDAPRMIEMNAAVKLDRRPAAEVAAAFVGERSNEKIEVETESAASRMWRHTLEHLGLVAISLSLAIALAIPLGIIAQRRRRFGQIVLASVGVAQTIPSLALLVFMIPLLGIGAAPAIAALFLYSLLPIVRNTHQGLSGIRPSLRESAEALGLSARAQLLRIELPLALPSILAGIKTAAVINIGTATLGALIGAGGYGQPILTGIRLDDTALILEGAIPAALLALLAQGLFEAVERAALPRGSRRR